MSPQSLMALIKQAGFRGQAANIMYAIVLAESGGHAHELNNNPGTGDLSYGLAQINMIGSMGPERLRQYGLRSNDDLYDPLTNLRVAYALSNGGRDFSPWSTYNSGAYRAHLGGTNAIVTSGPIPGGGGASTNSSADAGGGAPAPTSADYKSALGDLGGLLTGIPELHKILSQAVAGGWAVTKFQQEVQASEWYRTHNQATRQLIALKFSDPREYATRIHNAESQVQNLADQLGIHIGSPVTLNALAHQFIVNGWDQTTLQRQIGKLFNPLAGGAVPGGAIGDAYQQLKELYASYGIPVADSTLRYRALQMAENVQNSNSYKNNAIASAKSMFPSLAAQLDSGLTVKDIADPYIQTMGNILEIDPNTLGIDNPLIKKALQGSVVNGGGKATATSTPLWQFEQTLRNDPRWAYTHNARDTVSSALVKIGADFGFGPMG